MSTVKATELQDHLTEAVGSLVHDIEANKKAVATKLAAPAPHVPDAVGLLDPENTSLAAGAANVGGTVIKGAGDLVGGAAGTVADAGGIVVDTADTLHKGIDNFFGSLRKKLGI